jgi:hypothetical protein
LAPLAFMLSATAPIMMLAAAESKDPRVLGGSRADRRQGDLGSLQPTATSVMAVAAGTPA